MPETSPEERIETLVQLGFPRERCEQAIELHGTNLEAATEWLVATSTAQGNTDVSFPPGWQRVHDRSEGTNQSHDIVPNPLDVLSGADVMKIFDCGDGWVVMNCNAEPLLFACEESTWYGKLFAGRMREAEYLLLDINRCPILSAKKPFNWISQGAMVQAKRGPANTTAATSLGTIQQEFDLFTRKFLVSDSTPNHAAGVLLVEAALTEPVFHIRLDGEVLGRVVQPGNGMGIANLELRTGALDPFRSNRMRAMLLCVTLMICDFYWSLSPGSATILKFPLPR